MDDSYGEEEVVSEEDVNGNYLEIKKRVSPSSKVNINKLSDKEKEMRFKNMAKNIKRLKAQVRSLKKRCIKLNQKVKMQKCM